MREIPARHSFPGRSPVFIAISCRSILVIPRPNDAAVWQRYRSARRLTPRLSLGSSNELMLPMSSEKVRSGSD